MSFEVHTLSCFDKKVKRLAKKYKSLRKDLACLYADLAENPYQGADLGGGVRKVRMAISDKGRGKSGGARVITYTVAVDKATGRVTLLTLYDKNEQDAISQNEIATLVESVSQAAGTADF